MYSFIYSLQTFVIPAIALVIPLIIFLRRVLDPNVSLLIPKYRLRKFIVIWTILSTILFSVLIYLTGAVNVFFRLEKGVHITNRDLTWNATQQIQIKFIYNPGFSLIVISIFSGLLYASLLALPRVCTNPKVPRVPSKEIEIDAPIGSKSAYASVSSSIPTAASAITSTVACCSTTAIAVLVPSIGVFFAPYALWLLIGSLGLLIYSFNNVVMKRFPYSSNSEKLLIS